MDNWTPYAKATYVLERRYTRAFITHIQAFRSSFIDYLQANGIQSTQAHFAAAHLQLDIAPTLQEVYRKAGVLGARMQYRHIKKFVREGRKANGFGLNEQWIAAVLSYLRINLLNLAARITETMRSDALAILAKGIDEGWGIEQMVQALGEKGFIRRRAQRIARTEVNRAANVGHSIGAQSLPYEVEKKWIAAKDHRTRHSHRLVNGTRTEEHGTFSVPIYRGVKPTGAFDAMQFPGDPNASAGNTVNCRCRVIYEPKRAADGSLIPRTGQSAVIIPMNTVQTVEPSQIAAALRKAITFSVG